MNNATINLGDTVSGCYYGTAYTGTVRGFSGAAVLVTVPAEWTHKGRSYDGLIAVDTRATSTEEMPRVIERGEVANYIVDQGNVWAA